MHGVPVVFDGAVADEGLGVSEPLQTVYLARHCETAWSLSRQHTGRTDLPLTERGERNAVLLGERLRRLAVTSVFTSPLQRAARTCELAGFGDRARSDDDLLEWDYGAFEGLRTDEILAARPGWDLFRDGCPQGEGPDEVVARVDRLIARLRGAGGTPLLFSSGHLLRSLAARWLGQPLEAGRLLILSTGSLSALGYDHGPEEPAIKLWNETHPGAS